MTLYQPNKPYQQLPPLPPELEVETRAVLKQCIQSRAALAELKQAAELIPNPAMLINTLPIMEAQASSEIENIVTTNDRLFQFMDEESQADPITKEALRYRSALFAGVEFLKNKPLCTQTAVLVCSTIKGKPMDIRSLPGTALRESNTGNIIYTPQEGSDVIRDKLANWERLIHRQQEILDPLIVMVMAHYQFEAIHPFSDGNGRTGRILNSLFLIEKNLLTLPILYLSRYIIQNKTAYYDGLKKVTEQNHWEAWVLYILKGIAETALWTTAKINGIRNLQEATVCYIKEKKNKIYSHELINALFEQPYIRISNLEKREIAGRQTASKYLKALCDMGVLTEIQRGRDKLFIHARLLNMLINDTNDFDVY